jgi:hypothetical protein
MIAGYRQQVQALKGFVSNNFVWESDLRICEIFLGLPVEIEL